MLNALPYFDGDLVVSELQLDLLEHRVGDRIDEDDAAVNAARVHDKDLLVTLLQAKEFRLRVVECASIVKIDEVFAAFVRADGDTFLREACVLLYVPDLKNPVRIQSLNAATSLITD